MDGILDAAFGFPAMLLTAALLTAAGFWLLVLCGAVPMGVFDADVSGAALWPDGLPVAVAGTVFIAAGWVLDVAGCVLLGRLALPALGFFLSSIALFLAASALSWRLTCELARRAARRGERPRRAAARPGARTAAARDHAQHHTRHHTNTHTHTPTRTAA